MKILILAHDYPPSTRHPGSPRLYNLCKELARTHELTLCLLAASEERRRAFTLDNAADRVFVDTVEIAPEGNRPVPLVTRLLRKFWHRLLITPNFSRRIMAPEYVARVRDVVTQACRTHGAEVLYVDGVSGFQFVPPDLPIPLAVDLCDCASWLVSQSAAREPALLRRLSLKLVTHSVRAEERRVLEKAALALTISPVDANEFRAIYSKAEPLIVQNGVDQEYFEFQPARTASRTLIFTGVMGYPPNADAAIFGAREIFPLVRARFPDARLMIVGAQPPADVQRLAELDSVTVTGWVSDVRPYMRDSAVFLCPLRVGAGVKNKIFAAMSMGLPVVANSLSLSGIAARNGEEVLVAETPAEFAERVCALFESPERAIAISDKARRLVEKKYSWASQGVVLDGALARLALPATDAAQRRNVSSG